MKRSAFQRVIELEHPDVVMLQETLGVGDVVKCQLESWFPGWSFETLDVRGRSGGLAIGRNIGRVRLLNIWGLESVLGMSLKAMDLVDTFTVVNVYGPYLNRVLFWDKLFNNSLLRGDMMVIGGDFNFSLGQAEVWGPHAHVDLLTDYFT